MFTSPRRSGWGTLVMLAAFFGLLVVMPFRLIDRVPTTTAAAPPVQAVPKPPCLQRQLPFSHFSFPVDRKLYGPGMEFKYNQGDFGPTAVPAGLDLHTQYEEYKAAVIKTYIDALCGIAEGPNRRGGNPQLYQIGLLAYDPTHDVNTTVATDWDLWAIGLEGYLASIDWEKSYIVEEDLPEGMYTLTMEVSGGSEPNVRAIQHNQPWSTYFVLRFFGSNVEDPRRLECFFQPPYLTKGDVPVSLRP